MRSVGACRLLETARSPASKVCLAGRPGLLKDHRVKGPQAPWTLPYAQLRTVVEAVKKMSDALTAANMITNAMVINDITDAFITARQRRGHESEIAHLRAWLDWMERRHQTLVTTIESGLDVVKAQMAADGRRIAELERENAELQRHRDELQRRNEHYADLLIAAEAANREKATKLARVHIHGLPGLEMPYP
jgi:hypothetical protein